MIGVSVYYVSAFKAGILLFLKFSCYLGAICLTMVFSGFWGDLLASKGEVVK